MAIDPVCKMEVEEDDAVASSEYQGNVYYFCSDACREAFERSPAEYARQAS